MFETSMVQTQAKARRGRFGLLSVSIVAHTAVILGATVVSVASVDFPKVAPDEVSIPILLPAVTIPPPLGNLNGGGTPPKPEPAPKPATPPPPTNQVTAPADIPDEIPDAEPNPLASGASTDSGPATGPGTVPGPIGVPWGDENSPGPLDAPPVVNAAPPVEEKVYTVGGDVTAPVLIRRVDPLYPEVMRRSRMKANVIIKCVIDKNGTVRDLEIVRSSMPPFNDSVMNAVQQWRYKPGAYRGQAVDTYLTVSVTFGVN